MSKKYLLALDCGTQSVRALVFDLQGNLLCKGQKSMQAYCSPRPGLVEQEANCFWNNLAQACQDLWAQQVISSRDISGVALTTQRASLLPLDEEGRPLRPVVSWLDQRKCQDLPLLSAKRGLLLWICGLLPAVQHFQARALDNWLAEKEPQIWAKTHKYLLLSGYLHFRLCAEFKDSSASQVGYLPFDYKRQGWLPARHWKWQLFRVRAEQLPDLAAPGQVLGYICPAAAKETGLPQGLPVISAAADKACEALGAGCIQSDQACLGLGTTATVNVSSAKYVPPRFLLPPYPAAIPGTYTLEIQNFRGYWLLSWFKQEFGYPELQKARQEEVSPDQILNRMLDQTQPGCLGLMVQPFWTPGVRSPGPEAKGAILGFGDVHTRAHIYRAILEGLAFALLQGKQEIEKRLGQRINTLVAAGGGAQSRQVLQLTADVFGQQVHRPQTHETSGLGAAITLAVGLGFYPDFTSAVQNMSRLKPGIAPNAQNHRLYSQLFSRVYKKLYPRLKPVYREIRKITAYPE